MASNRHFLPPRDPRDPLVELRDEYPQTDETIARAKEAQEIERAEFFARLLAKNDHIFNLDEQPAHIRQHYGSWALIAMRGAALSADQFRLCGVSTHAAAQAALDFDAHQEGYTSVDLLSAANAIERAKWTQVASRVIQTYLNVMGGKTTAMAQRLYAGRLYVIPGGKS